MPVRGMGGPERTLLRVLTAALLGRFCIHNRFLLEGLVGLVVIILIFITADLPVRCFIPFSSELLYNVGKNARQRVFVLG